MMTKRGQMIYDHFKQNPDHHPTAEEIYSELKLKDNKIGVATVYRNLKHLVEKGYLKEINLEKQGVRYDLADTEHYHFICNECGNIENFFLDSLHTINDSVEKVTSGVITDKNLIFNGICKNCLKNK